MELTIKSAADFLGYSRFYLIKLLKEGVIPYTTIGKHKRIKLEDLENYKRTIKDSQKKLLIELMKQDEDFKMYDL